ncbi:rRNA methylases [Georgfuchsia toluolica]|uniref:rRNA methylases n=1 Tax=Georgfuchsia toluolica TaxID=424218 RepID=A0A916J2L3_9PROT|nr:RNA methyltransferase [Georgfuchsia toluolica]CAG4882234.1 rRNA methylases [Georgfuchsia toluolica]
MKSISSRDNPAYKKLLRLAGDARECRKQGRTLIDGPHLVAAYRAQLGLPEQLLVSESGANHREIQDLIDAHAGSDVVLLKDPLFKALSGVDAPLGIAAVIRIPQETPAFTGGSCVLLDAIQDAGNAGSILRSSAAAGIRDIFLGPGCAGAWSPRVLRAAQGAHFRLRIRESADLGQFLRDYRGKSLATVVGGGVSIYDIKLTGDIAWIFGNEGCGVSPVLAALASQLITIPLATDIESLNVAAAAAVCLFAIARN